MVFVMLKTTHATSKIAHPVSIREHLSPYMKTLGCHLSTLSDQISFPEHNIRLPEHNIQNIFLEAECALGQLCAHASTTLVTSSTKTHQPTEPISIGNSLDGHFPSLAINHVFRKTRKLGLAQNKSFASITAFQQTISVKLTRIKLGPISVVHSVSPFSFRENQTLPY